MSFVTPPLSTQKPSTSSMSSSISGVPQPMQQSHQQQHQQQPMSHSFSQSSFNQQQQVSAQSVPQNLISALNNTLTCFNQLAYSYNALSTWSKSDRIALHGFARHFRSMARDRVRDGEQLIKYMNMRHATVKFAPIPPPPQQIQNPSDIASAIEQVLKMEKDHEQCLWQVVKQAEQEGDLLTEQHLKQEFLERQVLIIKLHADLLNTVQGKHSMASASSSTSSISLSNISAASTSSITAREMPQGAVMVAIDYSLLRNELLPDARPWKKGKNVPLSKSSNPSWVHSQSHSAYLDLLYD